MSAAWMKGFWNHPAGPKTIHFWVRGADQKHRQVISCLAQVWLMAHHAFQGSVISNDILHSSAGANLQMGYQHC